MLYAKDQWAQSALQVGQKNAPLALERITTVFVVVRLAHRRCMKVTRNVLALYPHARIVHLGNNPPPPDATPRRLAVVRQYCSQAF